MGPSLTRLRVGACLSLTGRFAPFGRQAARGLEAWRSLGSGAELTIEDDGSDRERLTACIPHLARRCDLLLGPYSTGLTRTAAALARDLDVLIWNHGGAGDHAQALSPRHMVSVLTPASRYMEPFLAHLTSHQARAPVWIAAGRGRFGRQVADGAEAIASRLGVETVRAGTTPRPFDGVPAVWDLACAGSFEEDVATVLKARRLTRPPREMCAVAAGVRRFAGAVEEPAGMYGVAQWIPGVAHATHAGPAEADFLTAYAALSGATPDYPGAQAAATAALAVHCARLAGSVAPDALWEAATQLDLSTFFGWFRIDEDGAQVAHRTVLVRWDESGAFRSMASG